MSRLHHPSLPIGYRPCGEYRRDRRLTDVLYGGDARYRLCQEVVLGIGGVRMLRALGYEDIQIFHMNEGHSSLLSLELLDEHAQRAGRPITAANVDAVRRQCIFTTHTSVPAGHDQFPLDLVNRVVQRPELAAMKDVFCCDGVLNMTYLGHQSLYQRRRQTPYGSGASDVRSA